MNKTEIVLGTDIKVAIAKAKAVSSILWNRNVCFDFNGVNVIVDTSQNSEELKRDYHIALSLDIKTVGPSTDEEVPEDIKKKLDEKDKELQSIRDKARKDMKEQKEAVLKKIENVSSKLDEEKLAAWHKNNQDDYGARIIEFAIHWSKLISLFKKDFSVNEAVKMACSDADFDGITGFMHSAAKNILLECLKEDEETLNAIRNS